MTARQLAVQLLFSMEINRLTPEDALALFFEEEHYQTLKEEDQIFQDYPDEDQMSYIREIAEKSFAHREEIDAVIERYAKEWKIERISKTTLAILRCAICEILYTDIPDSVSADEAHQFHAFRLFSVIKFFCVINNLAKGGGEFSTTRKG